MSDGVPEGWVTTRLRECITSKPQYGANTSAKPFSQDLVRYVRITDIDDRGSLVESEKVSISHAEAIGYLLNNNDILIARSGNTVGKSYIHKSTGTPSAYAGYLIRFVTNPKKLVPDYLFQYTQSPQYDNWIIGVLRAGAQPNINATEYGDLEFLLPLPSEQQKIASILTSVDDVIEKTEAQINKLQDLKKGMMQELLTKGIGHTEFKDSPVGRIPRGWKVYNFGKWMDVKSGKGFKLSEYTKTGIKLLRIDNVSWGKITWESIAYLPEDYLKDHSDLVLHAGDILLALNRPITQDRLKIARLERHDDPSILYQRVGKIVINGNHLNSNFVYYLLNAFVPEFVRESAVGSDQPFINITSLRKLELPFPNIKEQKQIGMALLALDKQIRLGEIKHESLKSLKKALMQDLLTGKVRVNVN